ncbi:MAG: hypothetical protein JW757_02385 [Anaerolineales bacterium]|nr:hypothetical protein [Anaerolineales bacterium]
MNRKLKVGLLVVLVLALSAGLVAFRPFNGDTDEDGIPDQSETLAEVLGIDVETLAAAYEAAHEKAIQQAIADGKITQEQADAMAEREAQFGKPGFGFHGPDMNTLLAEELGITVEELQDAQQEAQEIMLEQALEDGRITEDEYENFQLRQTMHPYFEEAFSAAFQDAVDQALEDGAITEAQAESLLSGKMPFGKGFSGFGHGGHRPGDQMKPDHGFFPTPQNSDGD